MRRNTTSGRTYDNPVCSDMERANCYGKRTYFTFTEANKMAKRTSRNLDTVVRPYRCRDCQRWHVGGRREGGRR